MLGVGSPYPSSTSPVTRSAISYTGSLFGTPLLSRRLSRAQEYRRSPLSESSLPVSPYIRDQIIDELCVTIPRISDDHIRGPRISQQKTVPTSRLSAIFSQSPARWKCQWRQKLKPLLVYRSENPQALKNIAISSLSVVWKSHRTAWITSQIFRDWFV
jgi:hypothetical protein